ncbi:MULTISPECIES: enoyl-CoA hydratase/isomerase family protein [unclassified Ruegeria]|uniref:enoyl-CoA hydratase/isomerase family protein n=1 Tax=unclassified Ruegeria TaxID=2625375 RepID=UPI0014894E2C|nr:MULTISPECIES: enoyl-CoA hydratase/isomerase family protein [unclassified Ruegeria]NOD65418.1 enoyl-CoA hydratase/isomerase family protein [Ruegeria sp. HKCCD6109]
MSDNDLILTQRDGACLTVTINRPAKANSLTPPMLVSLRDIFLEAASDTGLRAVIVTGAGGRVFCAGADLNTLSTHVNGPDPWDEMAQALRAIPVLTLAAINGPCIGGGMTLALACDIRVCVPEARFSYPVLKNNVLPGQYDVNRLHALIGPGRSAAILLGGDAASAEDAAMWGLVDRMVTQEVLADTCQALCAPAIASADGHLKTLKSMLGRSS